MPLPNLISSYTAPQMIYGGITGGANALAGGLTSALNQYEEEKAKAAFGDVTFDWLAKNVQGAVSPEVLQRYHKASAKERAQMALGAQYNAAQILGREAQQWDTRVKAAHANYYLQQAAAEGPSRFELTEEEKRQYQAAGRVPLRTSQKSFQVAEEAGNIDMDTGGNPIYSADKSMYRQGGKWKPVTEAMRKAIEDFEARQQQQTEPAAPTDQRHWWEKLLGGPQPQPAATPGAPPAAQPAATTPAAQQPTVATGGAPSAAQIKAAFKSGQITRDEAVQLLQRLGFK